MALLPGRAAGLALFLLLAAGARGEEFPLPDFDLPGVHASYVVTLPPGYDPARPWPLLLDFHGAISPTLKGAEVTRKALWSRFVVEAPFIVVGPNGRTRAWGTVRGEKDDLAYARRVLAEVRRRYRVDPERIYLSGFSSGSDFLCSRGLAREKPFAGCLVVCPGPPHVAGVRGGAITKSREKPFYFLAGEEDYVRKAGAFEAFRALERAGGRAMYREVPGKAHEFPPIAEYIAALRWLEAEARPEGKRDPLAEARSALSRGDWLLASRSLTGCEPGAAAPLRKRIAEAAGRAVARAETVDAVKEPGRAYEAWWKVLTGFPRLPDPSGRAAKEIAALERRFPSRDLYRLRRNWFRRRAPRAPREKSTPPAARPGLFAFDRYLSYEEIAFALKDLAERFPERARFLTIGRSVEGRGIHVLEVTDRGAGPPGSKPAVWLEGGLHGNEISSTMVGLYAAWQLAANPEHSRGTGRLLRKTTFYVAPAVNPDAVHHFLSEPHSSWRPRFNARPFDSDGDGRVDEDPTEDLDGNGEIGLMYAPDPEGPYVLAHGRLVRGEGTPRYRLVGREGIDNDHDGKFSEDRPGGVDLNRNFPVGFRSRRLFGGTSGTAPASEPETRAIVSFVESHPDIALFLDLHNAANCVFVWVGKEKGPDADLLLAGAERIRKALAYAVRPLRHPGAGLAIAWAFGARGIPSYLIELEATRGPREAYDRDAWKGRAFLPPKPFLHPQLGPILLGNDYGKIPRRNVHPHDLFWLADRIFAWLRTEAENLPRLQLVDPVIRPVEGGFEVRGTVRNTGTWPTDPAHVRREGPPLPVTLSAEGGEVEGEAKLPALAGGASRTFAVRIVRPGGAVTLRISHPRAGRIELPVARPREPTRPIRHRYSILPGYATPDRARLATNAFYHEGRTDRERGPAFTLRHRKDHLKIAVLLGEWKDRRHLVPAAEFERAFFSRDAYRGLSVTGQHVYGSVRDFYAEMSYGRCEVTGRVFDWATLPGTHAEYRDMSFGSRELSKRLAAAVLARDGAGALDGYDGYAFVWAGNAVRRTSMLWPMRITLKDRPGAVAFKMSELYHGEEAPIGVPCHELGHTFGVNDKYGLGASKNPLGPFCLIGKGTHGAGPSGPHRPFHLCAWCKMVIGWVHPAVIDPSVPQNLALRPILFDPGECYRILLRPDGSEYLLLENRRREGFFTDLPSSGLLVLKVGPNDKPSAPQKRVELLPAHGLPPAARSDPARPEAVAWPQPGRTALTVEGVRISNIRRVDDVIYFEVGPAPR